MIARRTLLDLPGALPLAAAAAGAAGTEVRFEDATYNPVRLVLKGKRVPRDELSRGGTLAAAVPATIPGKVPDGLLLRQDTSRDRL